MKIKLHLLVGAVLYFTSYSLGQNKSINIEGTVKLNERMYIKTTEVSLGDWINFIINSEYDADLFPSSDGLPKNLVQVFDELKNMNKRDNFNIKPSGREKSINGNLKIKENEYLSDLFDESSTNLSLIIPVTGISYEQALKYCKWKESLINAETQKNIEIELPDVEVYKKVITNKDSLNTQKCALFNWAYCSCAKEKKGNNQYSFQGKQLLRSDAYWPTELLIYNLQGNAGEMTATKGIAMGGSFRHYARESYSDRYQKYSQPEPWLGFRYIVKVK